MGARALSTLRNDFLRVWRGGSTRAGAINFGISEVPSKSFRIAAICRCWPSTTHSFLSRPAPSRRAAHGGIAQGIGEGSRRLWQVRFLQRCDKPRRQISLSNPLACRGRPRIAIRNWLAFLPIGSSRICATQARNRRPMEPSRLILRTNSLFQLSTFARSMVFFIGKRVRQLHEQHAAQL